MLRSYACRLLAASAALGVCLIAAGTASAQQNSLFGSSGALNGSSGFGTGSTGINSNPISTGAGIGGFGSVGTGGTGATGIGGTGLGGQGGLGATGMTGGANTQRSTFVGRDDTASRFVGSSVAGSQGGQQGGRTGQFGQRNNQQQQRRGTTRNNRGQNQNFMNQGNQGFAGNGGQQQQQRTIRPQQKVAFSHPKLSGTKIETTLTGRFDKLSKRAGFSGVTIDADGGTVTLRGSVDTDDTRKLAAMLAALEPGVVSVKNELSVQTPEPPEPGE